VGRVIGPQISPVSVRPRAVEKTTKLINLIDKCHDIVDSKKCHDIVDNVLWQTVVSVNYFSVKSFFLESFYVRLKFQNCLNHLHMNLA